MMCYNKNTCALFLLLKLISNKWSQQEKFEPFGRRFRSIVNQTSTNLQPSINHLVRWFRYFPVTLTVERYGWSL
jgi:hypothetical protein